MTAFIISHSDCLLHDYGDAHHPEIPERLHAIQNQLISSGVDWVVSQHDAPKAEKADLYRVHDKAYVDRVFDSAPTEGHILLDEDVAMNPHTLDAVLRSAGAMIKAVDMTMNEGRHHVFCSVRPPGHHAGKRRGAGFCIFNNVAIAAAYAMDQYRLKRVAILDFDVHHGDGTEEIFSADERVLFGSSFQHPYYPNSGAETDLPNVVNIPMPAGTTGAEWRAAVSEQWFPKLHQFKPELIVLSAGFDSHLQDDMGGFKLVEADYKWFTEQICQIAKKYASSRLISCLEGGYDMSSLGRSAAGHVKALAESH